MVVALAAWVVAAAGCVPSGTTYGSGDDWRWTEVAVSGPQRSQGLATDDAPTAGTVGDTWYTSQFSLERADPTGATVGLTGSLPLDVLIEWKNSHTGDPDAHGGRVIVPWENKQLGPSSPPTKSFGVYDGESLDLLGWSKHVLGPGETNDNPWVTISPDGRWVLTGRYTPLEHLEVYPVPGTDGADVPLVATVPLDHPPSAVQGCDFVDERRLVCASNDAATGRQVFLVDLDAPIGDGATTGAVTYVGPAPQAPPLTGDGAGCDDVGEVEGIDAQRGADGSTVVRVLVVDRCKLVVHEYEHVLH